MTTAPMETCFICSRRFQFGEGVYNGRHVSAWDVMICDGCDRGNWDGIVPQTRPHVIPSLQSRGIDTTLNSKGWLEIPR
jgi:hypothetical protein